MITHAAQGPGGGQGVREIAQTFQKEALEPGLRTSWGEGFLLPDELGYRPVEGQDRDEDLLDA